MLNYQQHIREKELRRKYKRETELWDLEMDKVPELPKDWLHWVDKQAVREHFIFYDYSRNGAEEGYCTWCEKTVPVRKPKHNQHGTCRNCGHEIQYKARGKAGTIRTDTERAYLIQRCENGFVIRQFRCWKRFEKGNYEDPEVIAAEERRYYTTGSLTGGHFTGGCIKMTTTDGLKGTEDIMVITAGAKGRCIKGRSRPLQRMSFRGRGFWR